MPRATPTAGGSAPAEPRREILAAAAALLDEGGAEALTIRRLALRSGYTAPAIYQAFGDKSGLLDALLERAFQGLVELLDGLPRPERPQDWMRVQFLEIVRFGREHPTHWRLMEAAELEQSEPIPSAEAARERLEAPLEALVHEGALAAGDLEAMRQSFWALVHGLIALPASRPDVEWRADLAEIAFDAMLAGLLARERAGGASR